MNRFSGKQRRSASLSRAFGHKANDSTAHAKPTSGVDRRTVVMRGSALAGTSEWAVQFRRRRADCSTSTYTESHCKESRNGY